MRYHIYQHQGSPVEVNVPLRIHCKKHGEMVVISGIDNERHCIF